MDEKKKIHTQLLKKIEDLELRNQELERLILKQSTEFEYAKGKLEEQVAERTLHLQEQKEQLQAITENVPGVVFQFYANNRGEAGVHYVSPKLSEIFGIEFIEDGALFFQKFSENIHEEDKQVWFESIQEAVQKQIPWKWRGRYVKSSGEVVWFDGHSTPTVRKDEIIFDGLFIDITEKIEQEAQRLETIRQQEQIKKLESLKTMAGAIAHRFNNSMMAVEGNLELIMLTMPDDSNEHRMASDAIQAARGASQVGSMMLSYVGQKPPQLQELSLADLVREGVTALKSHFHSAISLKFSPPDQPLYCSIDTQQIKEVVESILINAIESIHNAGSIEVSFGTDEFTTDSFPIFFQDDKTRNGTYSFCQIKDSGLGISPENLSQIFEPFYTTHFFGRGLGLALTAGIMRTHHGAVTVESTPGMGTTVRILLPAITPSQQETVIHEDVMGEAVTLSGDILLADDEPIILIFLKMMLEQFGFTVHTAANGQGAVDMFRRQEVDYCAVMLDILMPEMSGIEAMKEIREIDPAIPVLLISGYSEEDIPFLENQGNRPDGFMVKPIQLSDLRRKLESLLSRAKLSSR